MFMIKKVEMVNKTFRLPADLVERLSSVAQDKGVSMNNLVLQCCEYALGQMAENVEDGGPEAQPTGKD